MDQQELMQAVLHSDQLPTLPTVASKLISLTSKEDTTLSDIADLISQDVALSAKILKVSNSALYSFPQQISSIKQAVSILGTRMVRNLVLSFSFLSLKGKSRNNRFNFDKFWERSLASAVAAKLILEKVKGADTDEILISGLLQNLGELIYALTFPAEYEKILQTTEENSSFSADEEKAILDHHTLIGYEVAKHWGFPEILLIPILYHHDPSGYTGANKKLKDTIRTVYLSHLLSNILYSSTPEEYHGRFRKEAETLLGLSRGNIDSILSDFHVQVEQAGQFFDLKIKNKKSVQEILQEANIKLSLLNLDYDQINKQLVQAKIALEKLTRELEEKNRILDHLANLDGLTGVYNHRYFQNTLDQEISRATRTEGSLSLMLIDIDHFKMFNDTHGHQTGDFVLVQFSKTLKENLRNYDTLARYGGEEFVVILPETNLEEAMSVAEKLRNAIASSTFSDNKDSYSVTASFGVTSSRPALDDNFTKSRFVSQADEALYDAKEKGRNRVSAYAPKKKWFSF